jgi:cytochrome c biogenesis protein CcmG/thiol:disulfide interchange protein DsbE
VINGETQEATSKRSKGRLPTILGVAVALGLLALILYGLLSSGTDRPKAGERAPDFTLALLDGSQIALSDLRGQVVVLNFWASWCVSCRREAPALQQAWDTYRDSGIRFIGVTYQDAGGASRAFLSQYGISYPNGADPRGHISTSYGVTGVPETFIIDRSGTVVWVQIGEVDSSTLAQRLDALLSP